MVVEACTLQHSSFCRHLDLYVIPMAVHPGADFQANRSDLFRPSVGCNLPSLHEPSPCLRSDKSALTGSAFWVYCTCWSGFISLHPMSHSAIVIPFRRISPVHLDSDPCALVVDGCCAPQVLLPQPSKPLKVRLHELPGESSVEASPGPGGLCPIAPPAWT